MVAEAVVAKASLVLSVLASCSETPSPPSKGVTWTRGRYVLSICRAGSNELSVHMLVMKLLGGVDRNRTEAEIIY